MKYTKNYNFKKPEPTDTVNVNDFNDSFDLVDQKLKETQDKNTNLDATFQQLIINAGSSNAEIVVSRRDNVTGETFESLPKRLDKHSSLLAETANQKADKVALEIERQRINLIQANPGSTSGDLALNDIKVGADGKVYNSPGDAVRGQVGNLYSSLSELASVTVNENVQNLFNKEGYLSHHGIAQSSSSAIASNNNYTAIYLEIEPNTTYVIQKEANNNVFAMGFSSVKPNANGIPLTGVQGGTSLNTRTFIATSGENSHWLYVTLYRVTDTDYTLEEILSGFMVSIGIERQTYVPYGANKYSLVPIAKSNLADDLYSKLAIADSWNSKIQSLQEIQEFRFTFGVQTDTHFTSASASEYSIRQFAEFSNYVGMDFMCNLGDIIRGYSDDTTDSMKADMTEICNRYFDGNSTPMLFAFGNHDDNSAYARSDMGKIIYPKDFYAKFLKKSENTGKLVRGARTNLYGYLDFDNVRVIILNTRDLDYTSTVSASMINTHTISAAQCSWFSQVALNTDKKIIVLSHVPLLDSLNKDGNNVENASVILNALATKNAIGCFSGHTHTQSSGTDSNGILHVTFANGGDFAEIVMVDSINKNINTKMIGSYGSLVDRYFTY